jgi:rhodanese-related sulfurtransferase
VTRAGPAEARPAGTDVPTTTIDPRELLRLIEAGKAPPIVDVRTGFEYAGGHVPGAVNAPFHGIRAHADVLPADRAAPLVVYCGHGPRARIAAFFLRRLGYRRLAYLQGHMAGWRRRRLREER